NECVVRAKNEFGLLVGLEIAAGVRVTPNESGRAERRAQIRDEIDLPTLSGFIFSRLYAVIGLFQIPVVDEGHQRAESVQFAGAEKRILFPIPLDRRRALFAVGLQPCAVDAAARGHVVLASVQVSW